MAKQGTKTGKIDRREDTKPERGEQDYGDVEFADQTNKKYPIDTPQHIRAACSYINHTDNSAKYDADEVKSIKGHIKCASKRHGIDINQD